MTRVESFYIMTEFDHDRFFTGSQTKRLRESYIDKFEKENPSFEISEGLPGTLELPCDANLRREEEVELVQRYSSVVLRTLSKLKEALLRDKSGDKVMCCSENDTAIAINALDFCSYLVKFKEVEPARNILIVPLLKALLSNSLISSGECRERYIKACERTEAAKDGSEFRNQKELDEFVETVVGNKIEKHFVEAEAKRAKLGGFMGNRFRGQTLSIIPSLQAYLNLVLEAHPTVLRNPLEMLQDACKNVIRSFSCLIYSDGIIDDQLVCFRLVTLGFSFISSSICNGTERNNKIFKVEAFGQQRFPPAYANALLRYRVLFYRLKMSATGLSKHATELCHTIDDCFRVVLSSLFEEMLTVRLPFEDRQTKRKMEALAENINSPFLASDMDELFGLPSSDKTFQKDLVAAQSDLLKYDKNLGFKSSIILKGVELKDNTNSWLEFMQICVLASRLGEAKMVTHQQMSTPNSSNAKRIKNNPSSATPEISPDMESKLKSIDPSPKSSRSILRTSRLRYFLEFQGKTTMEIVPYQDIRYGRSSKCDLSPVPKSVESEFISRLHATISLRVDENEVPTLFCTCHSPNGFDVYRDGKTLQLVRKDQLFELQADDVVGFYPEKTQKIKGNCCYTIRLRK